jgi:YD repeat-containing protein
VDSKFRGRQYNYDANNRQRWSALVDGTGAATSVYDGAGQRVATIADGTTSIMVYDAMGKLVAEYGTAS